MLHFPFACGEPEVCKVDFHSEGSSVVQSCFKDLKNRPLEINTKGCLDVDVLQHVRSRTLLLIELPSRVQYFVFSCIKPGISKLRQMCLLASTHLSRCGDVGFRFF